jgi:putative transposase
VSTPEPCRKHGIAPQLLYRWKGKYGGIEVSEAKHAVAELPRDKRALQAVLAKKC